MIIARVLAVLLCTCTSLMIASPVMANITGLSLSPSQIFFELPKGYSQKRTITLSNVGTNALLITAETATLSFNEKNRLNSKPDHLQWLKIVPSRLKLNAGEKVTLSLSATVPPGTPTGNYSLAVNFLAIPLNLNAPERKTSVNGIVTAAVIIKNTGQSARSFELVKFSAPFITANKQSPFQVVLSNNGSIPYTSQGAIEIYDHKRKKVSGLELPAINLVPGEQKKISATPAKPIPFGWYTCRLTLKDNDIFKGPFNQKMLIFPWIGFTGLIVSIGSLILISRFKNQARLDKRY